MLDQLADEYANAGKPVVFMEQYVFSPVGNRYNRWWAAHGPGTAGFPFVMVDSGNQISWSPVDYYNVYKGIIDTSLARPPQANVTAQCQRNGNKMSFEVEVTNLSGMTLSTSNSATVNALVYEDEPTNVQRATKYYVRAAADTPISSLANGATDTFSLDTNDLSGVDWNKLHCVALVDYRTGTGAYDMLQAAFAEPGDAPPPTADLVVKKTDNPDPVTPGGQLTYTIEIINNSDTALNATVKDNLPSEVTYGGTTTWTPTINAGDTWTTTFDVTVNAGYSGPLVNEVVVTTTEGPTATTITITNGQKLYLPMVSKG